MRPPRTSPFVLPARPPTTQFGANAMPLPRGLDNLNYKPLIEGMMTPFREDTGPVTHVGDVAAGVFEVATNPATPLKIPAGANVIAWMAEVGRYANPSVDGCEPADRWALPEYHSAAIRAAVSR